MNEKPKKGLSISSVNGISNRTIVRYGDSYSETIKLIGDGTRLRD